MSLPPLVRDEEEDADEYGLECFRKPKGEGELLLPLEEDAAMGSVLTR